MINPIDPRREIPASNTDPNFRWKDVPRVLTVACLLGVGIGVAYFSFLRSWIGLFGAVLGSISGVFVGVVSMALIQKRGTVIDGVVFGASAFVGGVVFGLVIGQNPFLTGAGFCAIMPGVYAVERIVHKLQE